MIARRSLIAALALVWLAPRPALCAEAAAPGDPVAIIRSFYDTLLEVMKNGGRLGFAGRRDRLAPAIRKAFDTPLMTRLMVGAQWPQLGPDQQKQLVDAFSAFSIATYANRFDDYSGESFEVDDTPQRAANGDDIVLSRLVQSDGKKIELDYLMRNDAGAWQIIDVYLSGTVSELATRRSEFSSVMRRGGASALVDLLQRKTAELSS
jgi:phospholipid transport system substrate-binding protein